MLSNMLTAHGHGGCTDDIDSNKTNVEVRWSSNNINNNVLCCTGVGNLSLTRVKYLDGVGNHFLTNYSIQASIISLRTEIFVSLRQRIDPDLLKDGLERQQKSIRSTGVGNSSPTRGKYLDGVGNHILTINSIQASTLSLRIELSVSIRQRIDPNLPNDGLERQQKSIRSTGVGNLSLTRVKYLDGVGNLFLTNNSIQASTISLRTELSVSIRQRIDPNLPNDGLERQQKSIRSTGVGNLSLTLDPDLLKDGFERQQKLIRSTGVGNLSLTRDSNKTNVEVRWSSNNINNNVLCCTGVGNLSLTRVKYLDGVGNHFLTNYSIQASIISLRTEIFVSLRQRIDPDLLKDGLERQQKLIRSTGVGNLSLTRGKYLDGRIDPNLPNDGLERQQKSIRSTGVGNLSLTRGKYLDGVGNHFLTNNSIQASTISLRTELSVSIRQRIDPNLSNDGLERQQKLIRSIGVGNLSLTLDPDLLKDGFERQQKLIRSTGVGNLSLTRVKYLGGVGNHILTINSIQASTMSLRIELSVSIRQKIDPDLLKDGFERQQKSIRSTGVGNLSLTRVKYLDGVGNHFLTNNSIQASIISLRTEIFVSLRQRIDPDLLKDGLERQQKSITRGKYLDGVGNHFLTNNSIQAFTISLRIELSVSIRQRIDPNLPKDGLERQQKSIRSTGVGN
ncbi:hypothetical protein IV203_009495 [Nitzschia inconspicua]|uniref:Uncharacterized protein n=1 Tax=Nitzschia inconspicua TaxID=303405 RepID=A0A9K3KUF0_9STRA|nr:hypothetical protein IV203_009495 [Nitzschia inconspicua]